MSSKPSALFVCVHNAGRSQTAAAHLTHLCGSLSTSAPQVRARQPDQFSDRAGHGRRAHRHHRRRPKLLTTDAVKESDVDITIGCGDACPFLPGKRYEDWDLDDPAGKGVEAVRRCATRSRPNRGPAQ